MKNIAILDNMVKKFYQIIIEETKLKDVLVLNISAKTSFADYFIICTATSGIMAAAASKIIEAKAKEQGEVLVRQDGRVESGWLILDYSNIVIHIFTEEFREFFNLEKLWDSGNTKVQIK